MTCEFLLRAAVVIGLAILVFQLYQWLEVNSARRDLMRALTQTIREMGLPAGWIKLPPPWRYEKGWLFVPPEEGAGQYPRHPMPTQPRSDP